MAWVNNMLLEKYFHTDRETMLELYYNAKVTVIKKSVKNIKDNNDCHLMKEKYRHKMLTVLKLVSELKVLPSTKRNQ